MSAVAYIRKMATAAYGRRAFEELTSPRVSALDAVLLQKAGSADRALMKIAAALRPDRPLATYEALGGYLRK